MAGQNKYWLLSFGQCKQVSVKIVYEVKEESLCTTVSGVFAFHVLLISAVVLFQLINLIVLSQNLQYLDQVACAELRTKTIPVSVGQIHKAFTQHFGKYR